jgi:hypothetical protein
MKLSKADYIKLCDTFRDKALTDHQDMRAWMNRALLAESELATLRAEYEPEAMKPLKTTLPRLQVRWWAWKDRDRIEVAGVFRAQDLQPRLREQYETGIGLFRGPDLQAHLTPDEARMMADSLQEMADQVEALMSTGHRNAAPTQKDN